MAQNVGKRVWGAQVQTDQSLADPSEIRLSESKNEKNVWGDRTHYVSHISDNLGLIAIKKCLNSTC